MELCYLYLREPTLVITFSIVDTEAFQILISPARSIAAVFSVDLKLTIIATTLIQVCIGLSFFANRCSSFLSNIVLAVNSYILTSVLLFLSSYVAHLLIHA